MVIVVGLGVTGLSCVRFLKQQGRHILVLDTRAHPPGLADFHKRYPEISVYAGGDWPQILLNQARQIIVSPGISTHHPAIAAARAQGVEIIGDIELFARNNTRPVIAITGSNGKSTVTSLVGEMARAAGKNVAVVGNIGMPVLDYLLQNEQNNQIDLFVMELSSFQLETTRSLTPCVATVLNISPDHLDRYASYQEYIAAKYRVYLGAQQRVINRDDPLCMSVISEARGAILYFSLGIPRPGEFGIRQHAGESWLARGESLLLPVAAVKLKGSHNQANALAALALGQAAGLPEAAMLEALQGFQGLAHRCQGVAQHNNIRWINDSKGTNIGASQAALVGLGADLEAGGKIILFLGGDGKGGDFKPLLAPVAEYCKAVILMGQDAPLIRAALGPVAQTVSLYEADGMLEAVRLAASIAVPKDVVLLSPACASLDQYQDYAHRGTVFTESVHKVLAHDAHDE